MNIIEVIQGEFEIIRTDETHLNEYRRLAPDQWEHRLNDDWVPYRFCDELEEAYQQWKKTSS